MKKILISFIFLVSFFFVNKVSALTYSEFMPTQHTATGWSVSPGNPAQYTFVENFRSTIFNNVNGEGYLFFAVNIDTSTVSDGAMFISEIWVENKSHAHFSCNIGTVYSSSAYTGNNITYSAYCPVDMNGGLVGFGIEASNSIPLSNIAYVSYSRYITFTSKDGVDSLSSAINNQTNAINNNISANSAQILSSLANIYNGISVQTSAINNNISANSAQIQELLVSLISGNSNLQSNIQEVNQSINNLNSNITNSSAPSNSETSIAFDSVGNQFQPTGVISSIITMPITLLQTLINGVLGSCSPISLGNWFGYELTMPCINLGSLFGNALWNTIDLILSGLFIWHLAHKFIRIYIKVTNLDESIINHDIVSIGGML